MTDKSRMLRYYYKYNSNGEFVILHNNLVLQEIPKKILVDQSYSNFIEVFIEIINENSFIIKEKAEINVIYINTKFTYLGLVSHKSLSSTPLAWK